MLMYVLIIYTYSYANTLILVYILLYHMLVYDYINQLLYMFFTY